MSARDEVLAALARDGVATPARWRVIITDSESPTGVAPVCTGEQSDALHMIDDYPGGPKRDEDGVYGCCPWPQFDTYSEATAAYVVELLNADAGQPDNDASGFFQPGHRYAHNQWHFHCATVTAHPETGERSAIGWTQISDGSWTTYAYSEAAWGGGWVDVTEAEGR